MVLSMIAFCLCRLGRNSRRLLEAGISGLEKLPCKIDLLCDERHSKGQDGG